jgi:hypothetical protein
MVKHRMTDEEKRTLKYEGVMALFFIVALGLLYFDTHYWFSPFSYAHYPHLTRCVPEATAEDLTFKLTCHEGEVVVIFQEGEPEP